MKRVQGFTLVEILVSSLLGTFLLFIAIGFFQSQLFLTQDLHRSQTAQLHFQRAFARITRSLNQAQLPLGPGHITTRAGGLDIGYWAGEKTQNCLGTQVLAGTFVQELFQLEGASLRCRSVYTDLNGAQKIDHQPFMHSIAGFRAQILQLAEGQCVDAVDVFVAYSVGERTLEKAKRVLFPPCEQILGEA